MKDSPIARHRRCLRRLPPFRAPVTELGWGGTFTGKKRLKRKNPSWFAVLTFFGGKKTGGSIKLFKMVVVQTSVRFASLK